MTLREILARREALRVELRGILAAAPDGDLGDEARSRADALEAEANRLNDLERRVALADELDRRAQGMPIGGTGDRNLDTEMRGFSVVRAIAAQAGLAVDAGRERELSQEIARRAGRPFQGIAVPLVALAPPVETRVMTTAAPSGGPGSNLIQTNVGPVIDALRARMVVGRLGARVLSGLVGNVDLPRLKTSATTGWVAENAAISPSDQEYDKVSFTPKHVGARCEFSRNMLMQPSADIEALIRADLAAVIALAIDKAAIKGGGSNEPTGVLGTSGIGTFNLATVSWANVLDAILDIDTANTEGTAWLTHPKVVKTLRSTLKTSGDAGSNFIMDGPNTLAGYPAVATTAVPTNLGAGTDKTALIFGDWTELVVAYWSELDILVNPYESTAYSKGNVQIRAMATCDIGVRHPLAFTAAQDIA